MSLVGSKNNFALRLGALIYASTPSQAFFSQGARQLGITVKGTQVVVEVIGDEPCGGAKVPKPGVPFYLSI